MIKLNNEKLCSGSADCTIKIWDWKNYTCENTLKDNSPILCLCEFKNDIIISGNDESSVTVWENYQRKNDSDFKGHESIVRNLCKIDEKHFASASFDKTIKIWDYNTKNCMETLIGHNDFVIGILKHNDGYLISCSNDKTIKIWKKI